ncbi:MAG TPA: LamG-like jellyroll fold domain-containing protein, partial [Ignavibacteriaceae bacterium]|nr:LamG-like jellyroll fold domain-containing protein [Ignavibacteriaceae bacterium]
GKYGGSTSYFLGTNSSNQTKFEIRDSLGNLTSVTGPAVNDGNWHHIAGVVDRAGSKLWIYVDGIGNSVNKSFHSSGFFSYEPLQLGYYKNTNFLNGLVDETAIYNRALSQIEITEHYYKGKTFGIGYFETPLVQFGLFKDQENLVVRVKPSANFSSSNQLTNLVFTIRWLNSFNVDLGSLLSNYNIQKNRSESTRDDYEYQEFSLQSSLSLPENWIKGKEYEILNIPVVTDEHKSITFELAPQGFTPNGSGDAFVEINLPPEETNNSAPYYSSIVEIATPVELISFSAAFMNGKVILIWITATELNNKGFNIERSFDNSNFTVIGFVDGSGSSINEKEYNFTVSDVPGGIQYYRLKQINFDGNYSYSPSIKIDRPFPVNSFLYQNFPNPFNPSTKIKYSIHGTPDFPQNAVPVTLKVYDILGREAAVLVNENQPAGEYEVLFDINKYQLSSGIYFYQLKAGDFIAEKKLVVLR